MQAYRTDLNQERGHQTAANFFEKSQLIQISINKMNRATTLKTAIRGNEDASALRPVGRTSIGGGKGGKGNLKFEF